MHVVQKVAMMMLTNGRPRGIHVAVGAFSMDKCADLLLCRK